MKHSTLFEDRGNAPIVLSPLIIAKPHQTINVGLHPIQIELPEDECTNVMLQSSGTTNLRITFDGTFPTAKSGFILSKTMPPAIFNLCAKTVKIIVIAERNTGGVLECQIGE